MKTLIPWLRCTILIFCFVALAAPTTYVRERRAILPGKWYPETPNEIFTAVNEYMAPAANHRAPGRLVGAIVPGATWAVSGPMSGEILQSIVPGAYDRVIILTSSHSAVYHGCSVAAVQFYRTPIGPVPMDMDALYLLRRHILINPRSVSYNKRLLKSGARKPVHETEYGIEVVLPMLQARLGTFRLMPFVIGELNGYDNKPDIERIDDVADELRAYVSPNTLIVVTTGLTHYGREYGFMPFTTDVAANIQKLDNAALRYIQNRDVKGFLGYLERTGNRIDGAVPLAIMMRLLPDTTRAQMHHRFSSADVVPDAQRSISYASVGFYDTARPQPRPTASNPAVGVPDSPSEPVDVQPEP